MTKRMNTYIVHVRFPLADGTKLQRNIAENALTSQSAINKVNKYYKYVPHETINAIIY
jgi:hypothetical protein